MNAAWKIAVVLCLLWIGWNTYQTSDATESFRRDFIRESIQTRPR